MSFYNFQLKLCSALKAGRQSVWSLQTELEHPAAVGRCVSIFTFGCMFVLGFDGNCVKLVSFYIVFEFKRKKKLIISKFDNMFELKF